jgi:hypothetical protein
MAGLHQLLAIVGVIWIAFGVTVAIDFWGQGTRRNGRRPGLVTVRSHRTVC